MGRKGKKRGHSWCKPMEDSRGHDAVSQYIPDFQLNYLVNIFFFFFLSLTEIFIHEYIDVHSIILNYMSDKKLEQPRRKVDANDQIQI